MVVLELPAGVSPPVAAPDESPTMSRGMFGVMDLRLRAWIKLRCGAVFTNEGIAGDANKLLMWGLAVVDAMVLGAWLAWLGSAGPVEGAEALSCEGGA